MLPSFHLLASVAQLVLGGVPGLAKWEGDLYVGRLTRRLLVLGQGVGGGPVDHAHIVLATRTAKELGDVSQYTTTETKSRQIKK